MRILVGVAERGAPELLAELDGIVPPRGHELVLAHGIDTGVAASSNGSPTGSIRRDPCRRTGCAIGEAERQRRAATPVIR